MSHSIAGFAGPFDPLAASAGLGGHAVARLGHGWGFLPVESTGGPPDPGFPDLRHLTPALAAWAARASERFPVIYLETIYFGGVGQQAAAAWVGGAAVFRGVTRDRVLDAQPGWAINAAARAAGVTLGPDDGDADEFDALGLGENRTNAGWADSAAWTAIAARITADPPEPAPAPPAGLHAVPTRPDSPRDKFLAYAVFACIAVFAVIGYATRKPPVPPPGASAVSVRDLFETPTLFRAGGAERRDALFKSLGARWQSVRPAPDAAPAPAGECVPVGRFVVRK